MADRLLTPVLVAVASLASQACAATPIEEGGAIASEIVGGRPTGTCEWPSVAILQPSGCSAALIHPRAVATAAHCLFDAAGRLQSASSVLLGDSREDPAFELAVSTCYLTAPQKGDFAVCLLEHDAPALPIISVMAPCETEYVMPGQTAIEVGFGATRTDAQSPTAIKSWIEVYLVAARSDQPYLEVSSGNQDGEYYGDSGGPLFFKMPDGTWRLIGTDSGSPDILQGERLPRFSAYANTAYFLSWAEQATGLDLTPCHDEAGWRPGSRCEAFPSPEPEEKVEGNWANGCGADQSRTPMPTCQASVAKPTATHELTASGGCSYRRFTPRPAEIPLLLLASFAQILRLARRVTGRMAAGKTPET